MKIVLRACVLFMCLIAVVACAPDGGDSETSDSSSSSKSAPAKAKAKGATASGVAEDSGRQLFPNASFEKWNDGNLEGWAVDPGSVAKIASDGLPGEFAVELKPGSDDKASLRTSIKSEGGFGGKTIIIKTNARSDGGSASITMGSKQTGPFWSGTCKSGTDKFEASQFSLGVPAEVEGSIWVVVSSNGPNGVQLDHFSAKIHTGA